jgi:hypothetical protein
MHVCIHNSMYSVRILQLLCSIGIKFKRVYACICGGNKKPAKLLVFQRRNHQEQWRGLSEATWGGSTG